MITCQGKCYRNATRTATTGRAPRNQSPKRPPDENISFQRPQVSDITIYLVDENNDGPTSFVKTKQIWSSLYQPRGTTLPVSQCRDRDSIATWPSPTRRQWSTISTSPRVWYRPMDRPDDTDTPHGPWRARRPRHRSPPRQTGVRHC